MSEDQELSEYALEAIEDVRKAYSNLSDACNMMGMDQLVADTLFKEIQRDHRTLQQTFWRIIFKVMEQYGNSEFHDGRNEASVAACKRISLEVLDETHLPFV